MKKIDYKKDDKDIYLPKQEPKIIELGAMKYICIDYNGDPNNEDFTRLVEALYGLSYKVKMSLKELDDYYEYVVYPLEGFWDLIDKSLPNTIKSNYKGKIMIRQPEFMNEELFEICHQRALEKKKDDKVIEYINNAKFEVFEEGLSLQMMHIGSYDSEKVTFAIMDEYCIQEGYERIELTHKEIYLSDVRKVEPDKLKTVLRYKVKKI